jgi:hypothetical protein
MMSNSKKKRAAAKRQSTRGQQSRQARREQGALVSARFVKPDIHREIRHITQLAQAEDSRIVTVGKLVLFSTRTRDAWLLDPEDNFALCLCRDGEPQPFRIINTPDTFAVEWPARFVIERDHRPGAIGKSRCDPRIPHC